MEKNQILNVCRSISILVIVILVPVLLVSKYDRVVLGYQSTDGLVQKIKLISHQIDQYSNNFSFLQELNTSINRQNKEMNIISAKKREQLVNNIQQLIQSKNWVAGQQLTESIHIINVQISSVFWNQKQLVKKLVESSVNWLNQQLSMELSLIVWQDGMVLQDQINKCIVVYSEFKQYYLELNMANRLRNGQYRNQFYLDQIGKQLKQLPSFSQCSYTNIACRESVLFLVGHTQETTSTYWKIDDNLIMIDEINPDLIFNAVAEVLQVYDIVMLCKTIRIRGNLIFNIAKRRYMFNQASAILNYLNFILEDKTIDWNQNFKLWRNHPNKILPYLLKGKYLSPYYHNQQEVILINQIINIINSNLKGQTELKIHLQPLTDTRIGIIDIFPNDFKIGIFAPFALLFGKPLFDKIKQLLIFILKIIKGKLKELMINKDTDHSIKKD